MAQKTNSHGSKSDEKKNPKRVNFSGFKDGLKSEKLKFLTIFVLIFTDTKLERNLKNSVLVSVTNLVVFRYFLTFA